MLADEMEASVSGAVADAEDRAQTEDCFGAVQTAGDSSERLTPESL